MHLYRSYPARKDNQCRPDGEQNAGLDLVLHAIFDPHIPLTQAHVRAEEIQRALRAAYPDLGSVVIHTEPPE